MTQRWLHARQLGAASITALFIGLASATAADRPEPTKAELRALGRCDARANERGLTDAARQRFVERCAQRATERRAERVEARKAKRKAERGARSAGRSIGTSSTVQEPPRLP